MKIFDAHFHIIDYRFPLVPNNGFVPEEFTCNDYLKRVNDYNVVGGAVVSGSFQAFDQTYLVQALEQLGPSFVGVTQLPESVSDDELMRLNAFGVRGIRFNLKRGGSENISRLDRMAKRVYETVSWHTELYVDSTELEGLYAVLVSLPSVSIGHLGLSSKGLDTVTRLAEKGVKVKATGFGRVDFDVKQALRDIYAANPGSLMVGTDLPSTRAIRPYSEDDISLIVEALDEEPAKKVFYENALAFYSAR